MLFQQLCSQFCFDKQFYTYIFGRWFIKSCHPYITYDICIRLKLTTTNWSNNKCKLNWRYFYWTGTFDAICYVYLFCMCVMQFKTNSKWVFELNASRNFISSQVYLHKYLFSSDCHCHVWILNIMNQVKYSLFSLFEFHYVNFR